MKNEMTYGDDYKFIPAISVKNGDLLEVTNGVLCYVDQIVNVIIVEAGGGCVLVDTGMPKSAEKVISVIEKRYGTGSKPMAILLTHGHFDHVGTVVDLVRKWNIPVFAHELELPFLTGEKDYPEPDSSVEGGMVAKISRFFPNEAIQLGDHVKPLPENGEVPFLEGFSWIHTPGHTPGHVSFFRKEDGLLIAGDAFVTVRQDSLYQVMSQKGEVSGPPRYFTTDWDASYLSLKKLVDVNPNVAVTGHGPPLGGPTLKEELESLLAHFKDVAVPDYGRFTH
ncbi:MBL fold metallo-hydrolase [Alteribacter keqinensis]|uniref:MBL fold metallo-hydrolase n=1 Tax=Alteribacter keqinensis TaxID=2483800 RepID=A0A3M7TN88_9BACI|nr:MBL fold metallo-hydrolase [Alteribacter keqinensis]RNA66922.1 MBL fold metallo-hydrolase [Alteribacter keqinensis]